MRKRRWRGVKIRGKNLLSLAYADDIVLLVEEEEEMRNMIRGLERYIREKRLQVNVGKSKMKFRRLSC